MASVSYNDVRTCPLDSGRGFPARWASVSIYTLVKIRCSCVAFEKGLLVYPYGYNTDILAVWFRSMDRPESPSKREAGRSIFL